jgi:peptide deformylase
LQLKLKDYHFDSTEVTEAAKSQLMLNTHTEHNFQDAFKKWQKGWEGCISMEGNYFEADGGL